MLKIFRQIRQQLIHQGNSRKYLLYALGEILLVMIGILLALQVNNWNEQRKDRQQERYYLEALKEEFSVIQTTTNGIVAFHEVQIKNANLVLDVLTEDTLVKDVEALHIALLHVGWAVNSIFNSNVWSELKSTGKVGLIKNDTLRESIAKFHTYANQLLQLESEWSSFNLKYRNLTNGILPPKLRLATGKTIGFYQVFGKIEGDLLSQQAITERLKNIEHIGGLIADIIIVRNVGQVVSTRLRNEANEIIEALEKELKE